ncbi:MAG: methyl-accepting chemotaxis protein [Myxococcota bacterium]|nr:HAMP domain-containing protein [Deltaproteobacteria bacterium]MDQ3335999.1 methyl-accepting chemotaxis protein [Myxococcota bacterium]
MSRVRFPLFLKFLASCLVLTTLLVFGGTWLVRSKSQFQNRGNFLFKQLKRYDFYQERVGRAMTGTVELLASDPLLRKALETAVAPEGTRTELDAAASNLFERLSSKNSIQPDVMIVFDAAGNQLWAPKGSPVDPKTLASVAAVEKARSGSTFAHRIQVIDGNAFQLTALPMRGASDQVLGGVLIAVRLQRLVTEYAEQTDDQVVLRYRPVLLSGTTVLASALPGDPADAARAMQSDQWVKVTTGDDTRDVLRLKDHDYDFYFEDISGYRNGDAVSLGKLFITRSRAKVVDPARTLPWLEIGIGVALSLLIAFLMGFWVTRPIKQMVRQSRELLAGETDLTQRIHVSSADETADLAENINQVFGRVHALASGVQSAAFQVGASSAEISAAAREMLSGLKDQTLKIESSTTAATELSASIQQVAGNAVQATQVAEQSSTAVTSAVRRMDQIRNAVDNAASRMRDLGESSKRIGNIVEVIRQISEQTSMLALNASIEAAHAGEQGRGFAVVADEVSSLARRVGQSAKDIEALIQTVKEQTQAAIASMEIGTREVVGGSELVTSTLNGLSQLITVVKETATAVHEQAMVSDEIARNMDAVRVIAGEMLHGSEESVVQADRLHELAFSLEESIAGFNLDGSKLPKRSAPPLDAARALPAKSSTRRANS